MKTQIYEIAITLCGIGIIICWILTALGNDFGWKIGFTSAMIGIILMVGYIIKIKKL